MSKEQPNSDVNPYQVMPELDSETYEALKEEIKEDGEILDPVRIDESGNIIDGHHRVRIADELGIEYPTETVDDGLTHREKRIKAYKQQSSRRNLSKNEIVQRFYRHDYDGESQREIADILGVGKTTVGRADNEVPDDEKNDSGKSVHVDQFTTPQDKRTTVWEAVENNPDASNREIAEQVGVSHPTVSNVKKKCESLFTALGDDAAPIERAIAVIQLKQYLGWDDTDIADHEGVKSNTISDWREYTNNDWDDVFINYDENGDPVPTDRGESFATHVSENAIRYIRREVGGGEKAIEALTIVRDNDLSEHDVQCARDETDDAESFIAHLRGDMDDDESDEETVDTESDQRSIETGRTGRQSDHRPDPPTKPESKTDTSSESGVNTVDDGSDEPDTNTVSTDETTTDDESEVLDTEPVSKKKIDFSDTDYSEEEKEKLRRTIDPDDFTISEDQMQELNESFEQLKRNMEALDNNPTTQKMRELFHNWGAFNAAMPFVSDTQCPVCGNDHSHLKWECCDITFEDSVEIAHEELEKFSNESPSTQEKIEKTLNSEGNNNE